VLRIGFILLLLFTGVTHAGAPYSQTVRDCTLSLEYNPQWASLRLRAHQVTALSCALSAAETETFLAAALQNLPADAAFSSLSLGRLIDYQWISSFLAESAAKDANWSQQLGAPLAGQTYPYVQRVLSDPQIKDVFVAIFSRHGYQIAGVNVEKVLISAPNMRGIPDWVTAAGKVPFDAICYIRLKKSSPPAAQP
jgi:hypothetical protein